MPEIQGFGHVALTVSDLQRSAEWYQKLFDATKLADMELLPGHPIVLFAIGPALLGLHQDQRVGADDRFDEFRVGLDHVAFNCADRASLEAWVAKLDEIGIEHSGIQEPGYGLVVVFRDPDNIQLELFAPPG